MELFLKYWKYGVMVIMALIIAVLTGQLVKSYKTNGVMTQKLNNELAATSVLKTQLKAAEVKAADQAAREAETYGACQAAASGSNSSSFASGVAVGKVLGRKETCDITKSAAVWPQLSSSPAAAAAAQLPAKAPPSSTPVRAPQTLAPPQPRLDWKLDQSTPSPAPSGTPSSKR